MPVKPAHVSSVASARAEEREVRLLDAETKFWFYPARSKPKGALIFVHGFRGAHDGLHAIIGELIDFDCYAPDLPGYGQSEPVSGVHDLDTYSQWLGAFISSLNLSQKPTVVGHSFGTMVVAAHAGAQRADMGDVVLINPVSKPSLQGPRRLTSAMTSALFWLTSRLPERGSRFFVDSWLVLQFVSSLMAKTQDKELRSWIHSQHHTTMKNYASKRVMYESYLASVHHCVEEYAPLVLNRTLMMAGERDDITSVSQQREVAAKLPNAELVVIPKVGHLIHYEASDVAAELIADFIESGSKK